MRLRDFQVSHGVPRAVHAHTTPSGQISRVDDLRVHGALVPFGEAVRVWLQKERPDAPFSKMVVMLTPYTEFDSVASVAIGVCMAHVVVDVGTLLAKFDDYVWLSSRVVEALSVVRARVGWSNSALDAYVRTLATSRPICDQELVRLRKQVRRGGVMCTTRYIADIGMTRVDVVFQREHDEISRTTVKSEGRAFAIEDEFPIVRARIVDRHYELLARDGAVLARVPIPSGVVVKRVDRREHED